MRLASRGIELDVRVQGDPAGETVVLLHGFPQGAAAWDRVRPALVAAGYRVVAPDQRGYSPAARPPGRGAYRVGELVADLLALLDELGVEQAHLVGHDWGGTVAWAAAGTHPDRLRSLTVVSTPHPRALLEALLSSRQALLSWYVLPFQLPALPERLLLARGGLLLRRVLRRSGLSPGRADAYVEAMRRPGMLSAALHWYRAVPLGRGPLADPGPVRLPTLFVWGDADFALGRAAATLTAGQVHGPYTFVEVPGGSHWIPEEHPEALLGPLLRHLRTPAVG
ncbi:MAG: alpha/beta fold hydrolase [Mycobacteriales bacterium]